MLSFYLGCQSVACQHAVEMLKTVGSTVLVGALGLWLCWRFFRGLV